MRPPEESAGWTSEERALAETVLSGRSVVVNVRKSGPHKRLVPWLSGEGLLSYVGHAGNRHSWPQSDFANPYVSEAKVDRDAMLRHYRAHLSTRDDLVRRLRAGELDGVALGCWCAPKPCHADVLLEYTGAAR